MDSGVQTQIEQELGWRKGSLPSKYLGIPLQVIDVTEEQCRHLVLRSSQKLTLWKQKCLSFAGRLSLIKHVLSMVPAYWSLVVKLPAMTCKLLNKMAAEFLWGDSTDHKNHHRIKWATLCLPKLKGGVGLRDLSETNQANLAYLVYRMSQQSSPWAELVRGRYYEHKGMTDNNIRGKRVSKAWRRALQAWSRIKGDVRWKIGNGELAKFWTDQIRANLSPRGALSASKRSKTSSMCFSPTKELGLSGITSLINLGGPNNGIGVPIISCKVLFGGIRKASKKKALTNAGKIVSIWRFGSFGKLVITLSIKEISPLAVWQHNFGCTGASTGEILIGKEPSITKFVTGFALGFLGAMASCMKIDESISASLRGARTTKEEWQVSLETFLVGSGLA
ncbi:putative ribonuclease H protein [Nymphaea thermarum]|nr:putative ribonuclease H protein [Nymphaea thermarum]